MFNGKPSINTFSPENFAATLRSKNVTQVNLSSEFTETVTCSLYNWSPKVFLTVSGLTVTFDLLTLIAD